MSRLTTDNPTNNIEALLNFARAENGRVVLSYANGEEEKDLCEYVAEVAREKGCNLTSVGVMNGSCLECDCELAILYVVAVQAAELRARLKAYEDTGLKPEEVIPGMVRCSECAYRVTCKRTLEIFPKSDAKGYLHGIVHACEYGERDIDEKRN